MKRIRQILTKNKTLKFYLITDGQRHYNIEIRDCETEEKVEHGYCWQPCPSYAIDNVWYFLENN